MIPKRIDTINDNYDCDECRPRSIHHSQHIHYHQHNTDPNLFPQYVQQQPGPWWVQLFKGFCFGFFISYILSSFFGGREQR